MSWFLAIEEVETCLALNKMSFFKIICLKFFNSGVVSIKKTNHEANEDKHTLKTN